MASKTIGIEFSRLLNAQNYKNFEELIKCKICFNILSNPYDCVKCGQTFCYSCISNNKCPFNCEFSNEDRKNNIKQSSHGILSFLTNLKFKCVNKDFGCDIDIPYKDLPNHDKSCTFSSSTCPNNKCGKIIRRQNLEQHVKFECEYSLFKCDNCELDFSRNDYFIHMELCKVTSEKINHMLKNKEPIVNKDIEIQNELLYNDLRKHDFDTEIINPELNNFMKILIFQMSKTNSFFERKFELLRSELKEVKEEIGRVNGTTQIYFESLNNEIESINERLGVVDNFIQEKNFTLNPQEGTLSTESMRKIMEENIKETFNTCMRETILKKQEVNIIKDNNKDSSTNIGSTNSSTHNSISVNSSLLHAAMNKANSVSSQSSTDPKENIKNEQNVGLKKIKIGMDRNKGSGKNIQIIANSPKNRSPVNIKERSPRICDHKSFNNANDSQTHQHHGTCSRSNNEVNINYLKTTIMNQENISKKLDRILQLLEYDNQTFTNNQLSTIKSEENLKKLLKEEIEMLKMYINHEIVEEIKGNSIEISLDNSNRVLKRVEELISK
jgi:hypothetical protein